MNLKSLWHLWSLSLGDKAHKNDAMADRVSLVRTVIFTTYLVTNLFIVAGVIRHWNDDTLFTIEITVPELVSPEVTIHRNKSLEFE